MDKMVKFLCFIVIMLGLAAITSNAASTSKNKDESRQFLRPLGPQIRRNYCPLCDASVYSYCSHKLHHDACCCAGTYGHGHGSYNCQYTDCSFLHANSCQEFALIADCCCDDY